MSRPAPGLPFPHDVWLTVGFDGVPVPRRSSVRDRLRRLSGWSSSMTGDNGGSLRYNYVPGRENTIPARARRILSSEGVAQPQVSSFVVWWLELPFRAALHVQTFAPMTAAMRELPAVLNTHSMGNQLEGVRVEFRGEPTPAALERVLELAAPHMAA